MSWAAVSTMIVDIGWDGGPGSRGGEASVIGRYCAYRLNALVHLLSVAEKKLL